MEDIKFTYYCVVLCKNMSVIPPGMMIHVCCDYYEIITFTECCWPFLCNVPNYCFHYAWTQTLRL